MPPEDIKEYEEDGRLLKFKYCYEDDRESLEMLFAEIDDPLQTMDAIISKIIDENDFYFGEYDNVTERGRSLGVIMFGAEQFRSGIHARVTGNCAAHAYGRTTSIETAGRDYGNFPETYKNILERLEQGEYIIYTPTFRTMLRVKFPRPAYKQFND